MIASRSAGAIGRFLGDSVRGNAELSFVSIGVGMALGLLLGMVPIPLGGGKSFSLGVAGGPLVMALVLGWLGDFHLAGVFGAGIVLTIVVASLVGVVVPLVLDRLGFDPAVASSVFVTSTMITIARTIGVCQRKRNPSRNCVR